MPKAQGGVSGNGSLSIQNCGNSVGRNLKLAGKFRRAHATLFKLLGVNTRGEASIYMHLEFDIWGTEGWAWHGQNEGWGYQRHDMAEPAGGPTSWFDDNEQAQVEFTRAMGKWLDDPAEEHECNLERSLRGFRTLMGMCKSSLTGQPWEYGTPVTDQDVDDLQRLLEERE